MAKAYGQRPSELLAGRLGDLAMDLEVFGVGVGLENAMQRAAAENPKNPNAAQLVLRELTRNAAAERRYEERKRGA
jgi:hypothetical protein